MAAMATGSTNDSSQDGISASSAEKPFVVKKATYETEAQWIYRKKFIDFYEGQFPIERLECWSKILSNSKFYGCAYLPDVMKQLNQMLIEMGEEEIQPRSTH